MSVLDRFSEISSKIYMGGKFYKSQSTESIDVIDPATENKVYKSIIYQITAGIFDYLIYSVKKRKKKLM